MTSLPDTRNTDTTHTTDTIYPGGCHCGSVRFEVRVAVNQHEALDCNCSICTKKGFLHLITTKDRFQITKGEQDITTYTFGTGIAKHMFCKHCGMHSFYIPRSHPDGWDINLRCLDDYHNVSKRFIITPYNGANWEQAREDLREKEQSAN